MHTPVRAVLVAALAALAALAAACSSSPVVTVAPTSPAATSQASSAPASQAPASPAASDSTTNLETLAGTWSLALGNARVVSATGDHAGGAVSLSGGRYEFRAGEYRHEGPTGFAATLELDCNATRCRMVGVPLLEIRVVGGELKVVNGATLEPIGSFGGECDWQDLPGAGVVRVLSTGDVDGQTVPTALEFTAGDAGGVGTECSDGGHVVAWDVTATRQR